MKIRGWFIVIGVLLLLAISAGGWYWWKSTVNKPLEAWEVTAIRFWSAKHIHQDEKQLRSLVADNDVVFWAGLKDSKPDKPGTIYISTAGNGKLDTKTVYVFFPKNVTHVYNIIGEVQLKKVNNRWLVSKSYGEKYPGTLNDLKETHPELEWKEADYR